MPGVRRSGWTEEPNIPTSTSKALVTRSDALVSNSFLLLLVRHLLLVVSGC